MDNFYNFKRKEKPVRQEYVRQTLVKADFRDYPEKIKLIKDYAKINGKTYSDVMREITDQVVNLINQTEIEDL